MHATEISLIVVALSAMLTAGTVIVVSIRMTATLKSLDHTAARVRRVLAHLEAAASDLEDVTRQARGLAHGLRRIGQVVREANPVARQVRMWTRALRVALRAYAAGPRRPSPATPASPQPAGT